MIVTMLARGRPVGALGHIDWLLRNLFSFEAAFVLFLYSNDMKPILPFKFPVDETVMFGALSVMGAAIIIYREGLYLRGLPVLGAAFLFILWAVTTGIWSPSRILLFRSISYLLTFTTLSLVAGIIIASRRERAVRFFVLALLPAILMALYGLYINHKYGNFRFYAGFKDAQDRVYLAFGRIVVNGAGTALAIALYTRFASVRQITAVALLAAFSYFLLVAGGRGPFLGVVVAGMVGIALRPPAVGRGRIAVPYATVAAAMLFALFAAYVAYIIASGNLTTTIGRYAKLLDQADNDGTKLGINRLLYWRSAYSYFLSAPLLGHGLNSFSVLFLHGREAEGAHPHNILIQIACEMGIVGLGLFGLFLWTAFRHASRRRLKSDPLQVCVLMFVITSSMAALFASDIVAVRPFMFSLCLLTLRPPPRARPVDEEPEEAEPEEVPAHPEPRRGRPPTRPLQHATRGG